LEPSGDWALTDANPKEIYLAYERAADAAQLCALVGAKPLGPSLAFNGTRRRLFGSKRKSKGRA
jgi:hypothetical protein